MTHNAQMLRNIEITPTTVTELYSRQLLLDLYIPKNATVIGLGGIGTWVALFLGMSGVSPLNLFDFDILEESNRARLPYKPEDVGQKKTALIKRFIRSLRSDAEVWEYGKATTFELSCLTPIPEVIFDCTDKSVTQMMIYKWTKEQPDVVYIHLGYDGFNTTVGDRASGWATPAGEDSNYTVSPSSVITACLPALLGLLRYMGRGNLINGDMRTLQTAQDRTEAKLHPNPNIMTQDMYNLRWSYNVTTNNLEEEITNGNRQQDSISIPPVHSEGMGQQQVHQD